MKKQATNQHDTEALLQSLITQCGQLIQEAVLPVARDCEDLDDRRRFINSAVELMGVGATVGEAIARVRGGAAQQSHHHITVEKLVRPLSAPGEGEGV